MPEIKVVSNVGVPTEVVVGGDSGSNSTILTLTPISSSSNEVTVTIAMTVDINNNGTTIPYKITLMGQELDLFFNEIQMVGFGTGPIGAVVVSPISVKSNDTLTLYWTDRYSETVTIKLLDDLGAAPGAGAESGPAPGAGAEPGAGAGEISLRF